MSVRTYAVVQCGSEWKVITGNRQIGHYADRPEAFQTATALMREAADAGSKVELLVQDGVGELIRVAVN